MERYFFPGPAPPQAPWLRTDGDKVRYHGRCYNCGEYNHQQSRCPSDHRIKCGYCHSYGHKNRLCHYNSTQVLREEDTDVEQTKQKDYLVIEHINAPSLLANVSEIKLRQTNWPQIP